MSLIQIRRTDLETVLQLRMIWSEPPRSREEALSPGDLSEQATHFGAFIDDQLVGVYSIGPEPLPVLQLPPHLDPMGFEHSARQAGVAIRPSTLFSVGQAPAPNCIRASLSGPSQLTDLETDLAQIAQLLENA